MQQIDLYTAELRPRKVLLPLEQILFFTGLLLLVLLVLSIALTSVQTSQLEAMTQLEKQDQALQQEFDAKESELALLKRDESLVRLNERRQQQLASREKLLDALDRVAVRDTQGFSEFMLSLARQADSGLWLSRIVLSARNESMLLAGTAYQADSVPAYLERLKAEPVFNGRSFTTFSLSQNERKKSWLDFELQAQAKAEASILLGQSETMLEPVTE